MFAMVLICSSGVFASISDVCFKCFMSLYVVTVASRFLKVESEVAHEMHARGGWQRGRDPRRCERRLERRWPTTGRLPVSSVCSLAH
jgi:hypothetical protein